MILMPKVNRILQHQDYEKYCAKNKKAEEERIYCRHGEDHGLTVARVAYIYLLEQALDRHCLRTEASQKGILLYTEGEAESLNKEIVYGAGILHDIGRWMEYETGEDHALVGVRLATPILQECGFTEIEKKTILEAIKEHRLAPSETTSILGKALALADDWARDCKNCLSKKTCYKYNKSMEEILI